MSSYVKNNWQDGDIITAEKMNKIENALSEFNPIEIDNTLTIEGKAADAKAAGDAIASANSDIAVVPFAAKVINIDLAPSDQAWFYRQGYIRHAGLSSPGRISANNNYKTYAFQARQDLLITGCDFEGYDSNHWGCVRVSNEEPVTGVGNSWTGSLYDTKTGNIPTSETSASVLKGQWVAINYYRIGSAGDKWVLHLQETGAKILQPDIPLTPAMKMYIDNLVPDPDDLQDVLTNNFKYANPFFKYVSNFQQKAYSNGAYVDSENRISITTPFTPEEQIYIKAATGYKIATPIWQSGAVINDSMWQSEATLIPGFYYTISIKKDNDDALSVKDANKIVANRFEMNGLWDDLKDGKRIYKGGYIIGAPKQTDDKYYIDYSATNRVTFPVPLYVKAGSAIRIVANGQGFFSARFRSFDGAYLSDYIDGATTRYTDYFWNIDEDSYIYVVFRTSGGGAISPESLTGYIELYDGFSYMESRYGIIRDIFDEEAFDTREKVKELLTEPCLVFPLVTDIHDESIVRGKFSNFDQMINNIKNFSRYVNCDCIINLGDNTDGDDVAVTLRRNDYILSRFMHLGLPYYQAIGNHDTNYTNKSGGTGNTRLTIEQTYRSYLSATKKVISNAENVTDYYVDFDWCNTRLVVINSNYLNAYVFHSSTAQWLSATALNTNKIVLLATHLSPISSQNWNNGNPTNSANVTAAIQAFVTNGGTIIQLCGHSHADYSFTTPWLCVFSNCQKFEKADLSGEGYTKITGYDSLGIVAPDRVEGTASEDSWNVVVLRPRARKINFVRFGAGNDREYDF